MFNSFKIGSLFSTRDKIDSNLRSNVIYKFQCSSCNATYIGETTRHLKKRMDEHLKYTKKSHIYKHIHKNASCLESANYDSFSILDSAPTKWQLKLKEGLHISWENPNLNRQVKYVGQSLCLSKSIFSLLIFSFSLTFTFLIHSFTSKHIYQFPLHTFSILKSLRQLYQFM